ncbi:hypothetical protein NM208_g17018 [Fusarium decemcellulare]|uniref:Uncharacterized protein n=1 Tax=Fusarium decemcellulare TaxID=57161 RepID=A0ACC1RAA8_9HYPO|nr:hypothetical protein NM208_g17018 [Fusarium decemcellulare]
MPMAATPPTTPPAIAPTLVLLPPSSSLSFEEDEDGEASVEVAEESSVVEEVSSVEEAPPSSVEVDSLSSVAVDSSPVARGSEKISAADPLVIEQARRVYSSPEVVPTQRELATRRTFRFMRELGENKTYQHKVWKSSRKSQAPEEEASKSIQVVLTILQDLPLSQQPT